MLSAMSSNNPTDQKLQLLLNPDHCLCKEDVIWVLEFIKKKVADGDPHLLELTQPRLLKNFHYFAEVAMMLIHRRNYNAQETDRLREWIAEATFGLRT